MSDSRVIVEREIGGKVLSIESGWLAKQAAGSAMIRYGDVAILNAVVTSKPKFGDGSFLPLTVDYRERTAAAGKFPGGFFKREGRPTNKETLTMRLTDRPIRPLWPDWFRDEILIQGIVYSSDMQLDADTFNMIGASTALTVSDMPFEGPIGGVRIGMIDGEFIIYPTHAEREEGDLDLTVAGTKDALMMVECGANIVSESKMVEALQFAHEQIKIICEMQLELREKLGKGEQSYDNPKADEADDKEQYAKEVEAFADDLSKALNVPEKFDRRTAVKEVKEKCVAELCKEPDIDARPSEHEAYKTRLKKVKDAFGKMEKAIVRQQVIKKKKRIDGRGLTDIRKITIEMDLFSRTHGSTLFTRGETQALVTCTLGTKDNEQMIEGLKETYFEKFMLHYNFPPFSVGEVKRVMGPGRREIGHGMLAQRALTPLVPRGEKFPYTIRLISDTLESNGSSSMAAVCGGSLAMHHAGVPMEQHVAGIAMGLVMEDGEYAVLSDILGDEDHVGDMDFKVCGTAEGITALQMDIKCDGLTSEIMEEALNQAREGRLHILGKMEEAIAEPGEMSPYAPRVRQVKIDPSKIGMVIGSGGKMIRSIEETTQAKIDIEEDGTIRIFGVGQESVDAAADMIERICEEAEVGKVYKGRVTGVKDFGAFVEILPGQEGMCHISELDEGFVDKVSDIVSMGDEVEVKVILIEDNGRIKLSRKAVQMEQAGRADEYEANLPGGGKDKGDRGDRGGRGGRDRGGRGGRGGRDRDRDRDRGDRDRDRSRSRSRDDDDKDRDRDDDDDRPRRSRSRRDRDDEGDRDKDRGRGRSRSRGRDDDDKDRDDDDRPRRSRSRSRDDDDDRDRDRDDDRPRRSRSGRSRDDDRGDDDDDRPRRSRSRSRDDDDDRDRDDDRPRRTRSSRSRDEDDADDDDGGWKDPYLDDDGEDDGDDDGGQKKKRRRRRRRRTVTGEADDNGGDDDDKGGARASSGNKDDYPDTADMFDD